MQKTAAILAACLVLLVAAGFLIRQTSAEGELLVHISFLASNHAPEFYLRQARVLPTAGSKILFTADVFRAGRGNIVLPQNPKNFVFEWTWRGVPGKETGKNFFEARLGTVPDVSSADISLKILDRFTDKVLAASSLSVPIVSPEVLLYQMQGAIPSGVASTEFSAKQGETLVISAEPYFFNEPADSSLIEYSWFHRGRKIDGETRKTLEINLPPDRGGYRETFSVTVRHQTNALESARREFTINVN